MENFDGTETKPPVTKGPGTAGDLTLVAGTVVLGLALGWAPTPACAAFPERDITVVVPWAAGGGTDTLARTLAKNSKKYFGVNMNVVNRVGGVGVIAMNSVATSKPDGYTVGLVTDYLSLYTLLGISELSYRDFDLVALLNRSPAGISVRMDSPYKTLKDMVDYAKANPGVLTAGHAGPGQAWHLAMASLALKYGLKFAYVPFDGSAPVRTALVGGHVSVATTGIDEVLQFYQAKQLRILGVNSLTRVAAFPDVPTFAEAGFPPGVFNVVTGSGRKVGMPLVKDPRVRVVSFTGSTAVGKTINEACAPDFKHVHLEMGGKNPIIVMDDANLELALDGAIWGAFGTSGQRCTASSRLLVHRKVVKKFTAMLAERAAALRVGSGLDEKNEMGPAINESQLDTVLDYISIGKAEGARCVAGARRLAGKAHAKGWFVAPTVFADCNRGMRVAREEIFGPVTSIVPIASLEEGIDVANDSDYGLSSAIFTQDVNKAFTAMRDLESGLFYVNIPTIGAEVHLPFGGNKKTGNGHREAGLAGLDVFSEWKSVYVDFSGKIQKAQIHVPAGEGYVGHGAHRR